MKRRAILIAGPTAGGKSGAAIGIAQRTGGEIVNADSMQVYSNLRILTSRPTVEDEACVRHHLYGCLDGSVACSTGMWLEALRGVLDDIWRRGKTAVLTGGTGLYFKAALEGLAEVPDIAANIRQKWRNRLAEKGPEALHRELALQDRHEAARFSPADGQRIVRALEVLEATGKPLAWFHQKARHDAVLADVELSRVVVVPERAMLYQRIEVRFDEMIRRGALDEVEALLDLKLCADLPVMKAIGVRALAAHINGMCPLAEAIERGKRETRNYAKRQMTWVRGQMADWPVAETAGDAMALINKAG